MITLTRTLRLVAVSAAILAVSAQVAQAKPIGPVGHLAETQSAPAVSYQGTYRPDMTTTQLTPDRQDMVGTSSQAQNIFPATPVVVHTTTTTSSFDWTDAAIGAASTLAIVLVAAAALGVRGRRRLALGT